MKERTAIVHRRNLLIGASALLFLPSVSAFAGGARDFDPKAFHNAQEAGQSIVVQVHASW
jgi:hypothetical protein